jgi:hypothetical protein
MTAAAATIPAAAAAVRGSGGGDTAPSIVQGPSGCFTPQQAHNTAAAAVAAAVCSHIGEYRPWLHQVWVPPAAALQGHPRNHNSSSTCASSSISTNSDDDDGGRQLEFDEAGSGRFTCRQPASAQHQQAIPAAAAAQAEGPRSPLDPAGTLPCFVRCMYAFRPNLHISHWVRNPLKAAGPGSRMPVELTLLAQPTGWDPDAYVSSHLLSAAAPTSQGGAPSASAAACSSTEGRPHRGSSSGQRSSRAGSAAVYGPYKVRAYLDSSSHSVMSGLDICEIEHNRSGQKFWVVLQEQVGLGGTDDWQSMGLRPQMSSPHMLCVLPLLWHLHHTLPNASLLIATQQLGHCDSPT